MAAGNVPRLLRLEAGSIINLDHVIFIDKKDDKHFAYLLGLTAPLTLTEVDFELINQAAEYSETLIWVGMNELTPMSVEKSLKLMTELFMHFVAHSIAHQQGTLNQFPLQAVFERIANIMNQINTSTEISDVHESDADIEEDDNEEEGK